MRSVVPRTESLFEAGGLGMRKKRNKDAAANIAANLKLLIRKSTNHLDEKLNRILKILGEEE